ncbi:hypothetical protein TrCOL_g4051 [Triparma columacea]|uniref:Ethanolaminephosphotransferase n=1 Tax=Triparma columacea TaxID=722753 RepID=A0A9W7GQI2_9STRA|nr:hypothetical protein TrCOL_g4051 [Triparma columacea]
MGLFIDAKATATLKGYKYSGSDLSLTYKYILSPLAQKCVDLFTPRSVAPNTITLTGFLLIIIAYIIMWFYAPDVAGSVLCKTNHDDCVETGSVPRWVFLANAVALLVYQTLDNMDGKQARRTGSSSPLGMLFDHGCDALNSPLSSINWCVAMSINHTTPLVIFWTLAASAIPFYISTWEEYYTGSLILPIINGPSEGLILAASLSGISFVHGPQVWHSYSFWDWAFPMIPAQAAEYIEPASVYLASWLNPLSTPSNFKGLCNYELLISLAAACAIQEMTLKSISVVHKYGFSPLLNLFPFLSLCITSLIVGTNLPGVLESNLRSCMALFGLIFVDAVTALMLAHMTDKELNKIRLIQIPSYVIAARVLLGSLKDGEQASLTVLVYLSAAATFTLFRFTIIIAEITECLGIWCFDITTPRTTTVTYTSTEEASKNGKKRR